MPLSPYHQQYADQSDEKIAAKAAEKLDELKAIFLENNLLTDGPVADVAVLGCGDKRMVAHHRRIFAEVLNRPVKIFTFDITIDHLLGETDVTRHDCTQPLPNGPYDITYAHVLLKFIPPAQQFDLLINSWRALKPGGLAIHVLDKEEIDAPGNHLSGDLFPVPLTEYEKKLTDEKIDWKIGPLRFGVALILKK